ncbi:MAG: redoxin domain-containing protein [Patescibacteria group bacterium]|jgi:thiol-disulfide isomerase/thioredoxin
MNRPTLIALGAIGALVVIALVILSKSPAMIDVTNTTPELPEGIVTPTTTNPKASSLPVYDVRMPEFTGIGRWWNTPDNEELNLEALKGKVVLIDFWTYSCINCIRTYPFLKAMHEKYADHGLVIVGVHTPEFEFEKNPENVDREITKNGLKYPIALDPDYATWNAYHNRYWPAGYLFDGEGRLRRVHFGEGEYEENEAAIRSLLEESGSTLGDMAKTEMTIPDFSKIMTPETYFGLTRGEAFADVEGPVGVDVTLKASGAPDRDRWMADGVWRFMEEYVEARTAGALFRFKVQATKLHLVLESNDGTDKVIEVMIDGVKVRDITVNASELYDIAEFMDGKEHLVEIRMKDGGVRFYAATFS